MAGDDIQQSSTSAGPQLQIQPFTPGVSTWSRWVQRLEGAFSIMKIQETEKVPNILHYIGEAAYNKLCDTYGSDDPYTKTYVEIKNKLKELYEPVALEIAEVFKFNCRRQQPGESVQEYVSALNRLSATCNFGTFKDTALRNQFVFGISSKRVQSRLLETKNLTYTKALQIAVAMEVSEREANTLHQQATLVDYIHAGKDKRKKVNNKPKALDGRNFDRTGPKKNNHHGTNVRCFRCGEPHFANDCNIKETIRRNFCRKKGHIERVCFIKKNSTVHELEEDTGTEEEEEEEEGAEAQVYNIFMLENHSPEEHAFDREKFLTTLEVSGRSVRFEVDSRAAVTIMWSEQAKSIFRDFKLNPSKLCLVAYCKTQVKVLGFITVNVLYEGHKLSRDITWNIDPREFGVEYGMLVRGYRIVIPVELRERVLNELHVGHFSVMKMKGLARDFVWWPGLDKEIENMTKTCLKYQLHSNNDKKVDTDMWQPPDFPFQRVHIDFAGPYLNNNFYILVDAFTKWPEVRVVKNMLTEPTVQICREIFSCFGIPQVLVSDNGRTFVSEVFERFIKENGIVHRLTAPYHPASNGQAERYVQTIKKALAKIETSVSLSSELQNILAHYRAMPHAQTGMSPAELMFGRKPRLGETVIARDYQYKSKWQHGTIVKRVGHLHYVVRLESGKEWNRHVDQLRAAPQRKGKKTELDNYFVSTDEMIQVFPPTRDNSPPRLETAVGAVAEDL
ncbi:uncharacterized protein LOC106642194 [Copidosoma floridanum]|uniref:uncharacterized protein LOC106642194 n=1 Tax=Copidosoma floridanum TaxID=29053 RepID=UPI000C6F737D|nr:uncharacterized protein LOC106642194 [Copidosoma floridanum]